MKVIKRKAWMIIRSALECFKILSVGKLRVQERTPVPGNFEGIYIDEWSDSALF